MSSILQLMEQLVKLLQPTSFPVVLFLFVLVPILMKWLFFSTPTSTKNYPPSPPKLPIIGNLHQFGSHPHRSLKKLAQHYGPIMLLRLGNAPAVVVSCADAAGEIMKTHDLTFANRPESKIYKKLLYNLKDVSTAPYGEFWRQLKSICVLKLLNNSRVETFRDVREEETEVMMNRIKESCSLSSPLNLSEMFASITNDVVCRAALGRKYGEGENGKKFRKLLKEFFVLLGGNNVEDFIPWLAWINRVNGRNAKADRVAKEFDDFLEDVVEEHLERLERDSDHGENREDFVDILLRIHKDNNEASASIDRDAVKAVILDTFAGGSDTTSSVLEWAMTEVLRHPRIMKKLQKEVRGIAKGKPDIKEDDLEKMHYLKAIIKETLRYRTPAPLLVPRKSSQDVKVMGYDIAAGTIVIINAWAIARDPTLWDDPEEFRPERFLNSPLNFKGLDFKFIPFGAGRRSCPGISFAMVTIELVLASLVHKFEWELPNRAKGEDLDLTENSSLIANRKYPLLAIATPCPTY